ncbi:hypothetical protein BH11MYX3_BH11MYX3_27250 [soil metagenome]
MEPVSRAKVLIVDDEVLITTALRRHLQGEHDVTVVNDPHEALSLLREGTTFDVILCDLMMPRMTGVQLYRELSSLAPAQAAAMILMTGGTIAPETDDHLDGVPRLAKPFKLDELRMVIETVRHRA